MAVVIDTSAVTPAERFDFWATESARAYHPLLMRQAGDRPFTGHAVVFQLPLVRLMRIQGDPSSVLRTPTAIREWDPEVISVALHVRGRSRIVQRDRVAELGPGDITSYESSRPWTIDQREPYHLLVVSARRDVLGAYADVIARQAARRIPAGNGAAVLLTPFVARVISALERGLVHEHDANVAESVLALLRAVYAPRQAEDDLRVRVRSFIAANLGRPDLGAATIARAHHVSVRALYKIWEDEPRSLRSTIREQRLDRCHRDLLDPALRHCTIAEIGHRWGLRPERLSRLFHERYGCSPRELRGREAVCRSAR